MRRRRFFTGEFRKGETRAGDWRSGSINPWVSHETGPFPPAGPVRPGDAGLADEGRNLEAPVVTPPPIAPGLADIHWHGVEPFEPDFSFDSHSLAFSLDGRFNGRELDPDYRIDTDFYVAMNAWREPLRFRIPPSPTRRPWRRGDRHGSGRAGRFPSRRGGTSRCTESAVRGRAVWCFGPDLRPVMCANGCRRNINPNLILCPTR